MDEGSCSVEGRGIVLLVLATTPDHYESYEVGAHQICLIIEGNGEGTQEFKRSGLCWLPGRVWKTVFWAPRTVTIV
jgi:hypothetical protein